MPESTLTILIGLACLWGARYWMRLRRRVDAWPVARGRVMERLTIQPTDRGRTGVEVVKAANLKGDL